MGGNLLLVLSLTILMVLLLGIAVISRSESGAPTGFTSRTPSQYGSQGTIFSSKSCSTCHRSMQADWEVCPYDGTRLV
jgi:hypothetical protein